MLENIPANQKSILEQCAELHSNLNAYKIRSRNTQECSLIMEAKNCHKFRENNYLCDVNVAMSYEFFRAKFFFC